MRKLMVLVAGSRSYTDLATVRREMNRVWQEAKRLSFELEFVVAVEPTRSGAIRPMTGVAQLVLDVVSNSEKVPTVSSRTKDRILPVRGVEVPWHDADRLEPQDDERGVNRGVKQSAMRLWIDDAMEELREGEESGARARVLLFEDGPDEWIQDIKSRWVEVDRRPRASLTLVRGTQLVAV